MLDETRHKIFVYGGIIVGLILAILLVYLFLLRNQDLPEEPAPQPVIPAPEVVPTQPSGQAAPVQEVPVVIEEPEPEILLLPDDNAEERLVIQIARTFVERFGTYSSHNQNAHIEEILPLVTPRMAIWVQTQAIDQTDQYRGASTRVIERRMESFEEDRAVVFVGVQQAMQTDTGQEQQYRRGTIRLEKVEDVWKVDGLFWEQ